MTTEMESIQTQADLLAYLLEYQDVIYVREYVENQGWSSPSLAELPVKLRARRILDFLREGRIPVRLKRDSEISPPTTQEDRS